MSEEAAARARKLVEEQAEQAKAAGLYIEISAETNVAGLSQLTDQIEKMVLALLASKKLKTVDCEPMENEYESGVGFSHTAYEYCLGVDRQTKKHLHVFGNYGYVYGKAYMDVKTLLVDGEDGDDSEEAEEA
jgi:hypothetical protein